MNDIDRFCGGFPKADLEYELIRAVGTGDPVAFEALVKRYQNPVLNFIHKYLGSRFDAEDVAQEVFLRVYRAASEFEPKAKVSTWIFKIAYNMSLNEIVRRRRWRLISGKGVEAGSLEKTARDNIEGRELKEELMQSIRQLPEKQRAALLLRVDEELSYSEIGRVLSTSVSGVESLLFRARENLRKILNNQLED